MNRTLTITETPSKKVDDLALTAFTARGGLASLERPAKPLTEAALSDWIARARVGESIEYHTGFLQRDRSKSRSTLPGKERSRLHATATKAWAASEQGLVHLFSLRVGEAQYRYLAIRTDRVFKPPDTLTSKPSRKAKPVSQSTASGDHA